VFGEHASRQELIVTFLAVLELIKTGKIFARQPKLFGDIRLYANGKAGIN
jgi:segregation and condensation protein A